MSVYAIIQVIKLLCDKRMRFLKQLSFGTLTKAVVKKLTRGSKHQVYSLRYILSRCFFALSHA